MREIKYRLIKNGKIVGYEMFHDGSWIYRYSNENFNLHTGYIENDTKNQYTGLKGKNGVEIYEGDIVKFFYTSGATEIKSISFLEGMFIFDDKYRNSIRHNNNSSEVIGNIYENTELLG